MSERPGPARPKLGVPLRNAAVLRLEIAPSVVVTLDRRAVAAVAREVEVEVGPEPEAEDPPKPG